MSSNKLKKTTPNIKPPSPDELQDEKEVEVNITEVANDKRTFKTIGFVFLFIALLLLISMFSYVFTWENDQDIVHQFGIKIFTVNDVTINNSFGALGAFTAHYLFYYGFGIASFLLVTTFIVIALNLIFDKSVFSLKKNIKYVLIGLLVISTSIAFFTKSSSTNWGGCVGHYISDWFIKWIGNLGTALLLIFAITMYLVWRFNPSFKIPSFFKNKKPVSTTTTNASAEVYNDILANEEMMEEEDFELPKNSTNKTNLVGNKLKEDVDATPNFSNIETEDKPNIDFELTTKEPIEAPIEHEPLSVVDLAEQLLVNEPDESFDKIEDIIELNETAATTAQPTLLTATKQTVSNSNNIQFDINPTHEEEDTENNEVENFESTQEATKLETLSNTNNLNTKYDPSLDLSNYKFPSLDLLETHGSEKIIHDPQELEANKNQIIATLKNYDIEIQRIAATVGPTVTLYEIVPAPGVRISRIKNLEDDIALSLAALGIRIIAPIPGKGTIGIEVPNLKKTVVSMKTLLQSDKFQNSNFSLPIAIGKKIDNENFIVDLATMPHLLMAGATGQGKSVGINTLLVSLLYKKHPSQLKFVLIDPKKVELSLYRVIENHFLAKLPGEEESIITDTKKVVYTLNALCIEMDNRYDLLKDAGCRNLKEYNEKFISRRLNPEKGHQFLPFIVLVIDEFADLIMTAGKEVEMPIARLAQLARAVGIHLIIATQRPSVNIITGTIKANFPARIAFKVSSKIDSRTILDAGGAEQLIGKGDMLVSYNGEITRLQCAFVDTPEVEKVCDEIAHQQGYPEPFLLPEFVDDKDPDARGGGLDADEKDSMFEEAARLIVQNQVGSTSLIQRRMKLGYNRSGRIMDQLERAGIVGPNLGSKARDVYFKTEAELEEFLATL